MGSEGSDVRGRLSSLPSDQRTALLRRLHRRRADSAAGADHVDVVVLGGGIAGLTLALDLVRARPDLRVTVLERQEHPVAEVTHKVGESTVEIAAHYLRDRLGLDRHLRESQLAKFGLRMFFSEGGNTDLARRVELGTSVSPPLRTYQVDRGRLENAAGAELAAHGAEFRTGARVTSVELSDSGAPHRVRMRHDGRDRELTATWVLDASGRARTLARELGLGKPVGHRANACWFRVAQEVDVRRWTDDEEFHARIPDGDRSLSTNHLMGPGYWVWLIRLASGATSVGIVTDPSLHDFAGINRLDRALAWPREHEPQCAAVIDAAPDTVRDFRVLRNYSYSCEQVYSGAGRWALTGEAGIFLDPLYSPGLDTIAIGNDLIVDLVLRDLGGEDVTGRATVYDTLFRTVARIWLGVYENQYPLLGNHQVMTSKVIWDTAFYWGVFGHLYFHRRLRAVVDDPSIADGLARLAAVSDRVQRFFREWHAIDRPGRTTGFVDLYAPLRFMHELHTGMADELSGPQAAERFAHNIARLERLAGQLVCAVIERYGGDPDRREVFDQIRRWQTDPLIAELMTAHRRAADPPENGWITLAARRPLEVTR